MAVAPATRDRSHVAYFIAIAIGRILFPPPVSQSRVERPVPSRVASASSHAHVIGPTRRDNADAES